MPISLQFVLGTRPEIIKTAPLIREARASGHSLSIVHTGQHYTENLDAVFFDQLSLPAPDYELGVGSHSHAVQTGRMLGGIESAIEAEEPDWVVVQGDTNSTLAGALTASKLTPSVAHVEAGLRSYNRRMPEEINRRVADHVCDILFPPTKDARENLLAEGVDSDRIHVTGNTVVDAVKRHREMAPELENVLENLGVDLRNFGLVTVHRAENVDDSDTFASLIDAIHAVGEELDIDFIYPIHPRAEKQLSEFDLHIPESIHLVEPVDYLEFLRLEDSAAIILTDSGGVQEEACVLETPCVTLRSETERPESVSVGANVVAGRESNEVVSAAVEMVGRHGWENPFGDGDASEKILGVLEDEIY